MWSKHVLLHLLSPKYQQGSKNTTMTAAVFYGPNTMRVEEIPVSNPWKKGTLLKVKACAVCGYDARVFRNGHRKVAPLVILGHEICGETLESLTLLVEP